MQCFVLSQSLPANSDGYTEQQINDAIGQCHMALELIQIRFAEESGAGFYEKLADCLVNQGLFIGPEIERSQAFNASKIGQCNNDGNSNNDMNDNNSGKHISNSCNNNGNTKAQRKYDNSGHVNENCNPDNHSIYNHNDNTNDNEYENNNDIVITMDD